MSARIDNDDRARMFGKACTPANHRLYVTPWGLRVQVHKLIAPRFAAACVVAHRESRWRPQRIDSYNCRTIRGSDEYSIHAWAMAWDFFATGPGVSPPGGVWTPDDPPDISFVTAFMSLGFVWGGTFGRKDTPHFEWASAPPGATTSTTPKEATVAFALDGTAAVQPLRRDPQGRLAFWGWRKDGSVFAFNGAPGPVPSTAAKGHIGTVTALLPDGEGGYFLVGGEPGAGATWSTYRSSEFPPEWRG